MEFTSDLCRIYVGLTPDLRRIPEFWDPGILGIPEFWDPRILGSQTHDPRETRLRRLKMENRFLKKSPHFFRKKVEITKESQGCSALSDFFRKPHKEIISMRSFSTERIGLRGHMGSTFSKRVRNFGTQICPKIVPKRRKWVRTGRQATIFTIY